MKKLAVALFALLFACPASAQVLPSNLPQIELPAQSVIGNSSPTAGNANAVTYAQLFAAAPQISTTGVAATAAAPVVGAGQIGYGGTTVAAGSGTCPSGTVGGQTVQGCIVVNIAGTSRNVPFF